MRKIIFSFMALSMLALNAPAYAQKKTCLLLPGQNPADYGCSSGETQEDRVREKMRADQQRLIEQRNERNCTDPQKCTTSAR